MGIEGFEKGGGVPIDILKKVHFRNQKIEEQRFLVNTLG